MRYDSLCNQQYIMINKNNPTFFFYCGGSGESAKSISKKKEKYLLEVLNEF